MSWLYSVDVALFRLINGSMSNSFFDGVMPVFAANAFFWPVLIVCGIAAVLKGGARGRLCLLLLLIVIPIGDGWITNSIKHAVGRERPCLALTGVNLPIVKSRAVDATNEYRRGCSTSGSFPSGHTTNWFAATMVAWFYYRRTLRFMLPLACIVGFSRIYNGVHYPSDVLGGAIIGAGYAVALVFTVNAIYRFLVAPLFPLWTRTLPSLVFRDKPAPVAGESAVVKVSPDAHWLRLSYILIAAIFVWRLIYLAGGFIELSEDEAYQWLWSKHPALSYFSKPPLIAYTQWLGTHIWGDTEFGVRFFSPVLAALASLVMVRLFAREVNARAGFWLVVVVNVTPLTALGSTLLTVDPLLVFFWTLAMVTGWRAMQPDGTTKQWLLTGLWMGLALLSKYTALLQLVSWVLFFVLWKPARIHLRRPGPYLAVLVTLACATPVIIWNFQHHWITAAHVANDGKFGEVWKYNPRNMLSFLGDAAAVMNPVFFVAALWAGVAMWKRNSLLLRYLFAMGTPVFALYFFFTIHSSVLANWIAAAVIPMLAMMVVYWDARAREGVKVGLPLGLGVAIGLAAVAFMHESTPFIKMANDLSVQLGRSAISERSNPLRRVRGWSEMARIVDRERRKLETLEGRPVYVVAGHYGTTSLLSFYTPDARTNLTTRPLVYCKYLPQPKNQFYFWPTYVGTRAGETALYVQEKDKPAPAPPELFRQFDSVTPIGIFPVMNRGRTVHHVQLFACRGLK